LDGRDLDKARTLEVQTLQILVTGRHVDLNDDIRNYIEDKAGRLSRFYDRIHEIEVILDHESEQFKAEMIVRADRKHTFVASLTGPDTFVLIDAITDKLERQLRNYKEKSRSHKGGTLADGGSESAS